MSNNIFNTLLLLILVFNVVVLDFFVFRAPPQAASSVISTQLPVSPMPVTACPAACVSLIEDAVPTQRPVTPAQSVQANPQMIKEAYLPIGGGKTQSDAYQAIPAAQISVDSANFQNLKEVTFEVFFHIPTGNGQGYVKLYNVTDGHDVWFSEVAGIGDQVNKRETKIKLDPGKKTYQVMAKSTLKYEMIIDQARLKIVTQ